MVIVDIFLLLLSFAITSRQHSSTPNESDLIYRYLIPINLFLSLS